MIAPGSSLQSLTWKGKPNMNNYEYIAQNLLQLLGPNMAVRITVEGYMPLSIEDIGHSPDGFRQISLCHYGMQNGDLMRDPDIVYVLQEIDGLLIAEPVSFQNDYMGVYQEAYEYNGEGRRMNVNSRLKRELLSFSLTWLCNLKEQGFFDNDARRDRLA